MGKKLLAMQNDDGGFGFWKGSPRYVEAALAGEIAAALPSTVTTVGVFVNESVDGIRETARRAGLRMVQLHGEEPPGYADRLEQPILRSVTLDDVSEAARAWPVGTMLLLDSADPARRGSGRAARRDSSVSCWPAG